MSEKKTIDQMLGAGIIMAPMAGITDTPFRLLVRGYGCAFAFTEMIDVNGVIYNNRKTFRLMRRIPEDLPLGIQLVGQEEDKFLKVAGYCVDMGYRMIDINAGCPARKVVKAGKGAALLKQPRRLERIVRRLSRELDVPVTVKIRAGWDHNDLNYIEVGRRVQGAGAAAVGIHVRSRAQMYKGNADHSITRRLKRELDIPVIASGNIFSAREAIEVMRETSCDAVYAARGALGRPWIFGDYNALREGREPDRDVTLTMLKKVMLAHYRLCMKYYDEGRIPGRMYKHITWYLKGFRGLDPVMRAYRKETGPAAFRAFLERLRADDRNRLFLKQC
ncbi:MAG: tRNA dihydrouridine synthase DusB [Candidatus Omnitrophica bacterium]|nr:tRNA dihydrouridine synthase DusB [Candidatus Omnitrophota bacterium]